MKLKNDLYIVKNDLLNIVKKDLLNIVKNDLYIVKNRKNE